MAYFFHILLSNIVPISIMLGVGVILQRAFKLDIKTLSKLNFYLFSPAVIFTKLYESTLSMAVLFQVLLFFFLFFALLILAVQIVIWVRGYKGSMASAMRNSVLFYNSANYAIPLNQLVFSGDPFTLSVQIIIMMMQNIIPNTYGVYSVNAHKNQLKKTMKTIFSLPAIYAIPLAFILRGFHIEVPDPIYTPIEYVSSGFVATALITLGVQLGSMKWVIQFSDVLISNFLRLCIGPALGFVVIWMLGLQGDIAKALFLSCAVPTSLSSVLLAVEFDNEPEFASQAVFSSTMLSMFTMTIVIYLMQFLP
ncbi:AEC family transporter [Paenibacillus sp. y28]|uniref:AEC family transporter n=1 Tax=Paenibacillus sp. y28 TaxID=3129110 RepID=UPI00301A875D